jgi:hypothetical protein
LRLFDGLLRLAEAVLMVVTALAGPLLVLALAGSASFSVRGELRPPYTVELSNGSRVTNAGAGSSEHEGATPASFDTAPTATAMIRIGRDEPGARAVAAVASIAAIALMWIGIVSLRRIVRSARDGAPFSTGNVRRLRSIAAAVAGWGAIALSARFGLERTLVSPEARISAIGPDWWAYVGVALGLLALAEVFKEGVRLREFEASTI